MQTPPPLICHDPTIAIYDTLGRFEGPPAATDGADCAAVLSDAVARRVRNVPLSASASPSAAHVAILFSGGLDCATIAALASQHLPSDEPIDLVRAQLRLPADHADQCRFREPSLHARARHADLRHARSAHEPPDARRAGVHRTAASLAPDRDRCHLRRVARAQGAHPGAHEPELDRHGSRPCSSSAPS